MLKDLKEKIDYFKNNCFYPTLSELKGKVLEIGFGDGENLNHYSSNCEIFALEKSDKKIQQSNIKYPNVNFFEVKAESLPFENDFFDAVVVSLVLCSVESIERAINEIERVLKPGGKFILLEHARSKNGIMGKLEDMFSRLHACLARNCHPNRDPLLLVNKKNFELLTKTEVPYIFGRVVFAIAYKNEE